MKTAPTTRIRRASLFAFAAAVLAACAAATALPAAGGKVTAPTKARPFPAKFVVVGLTDRQRLVAFRSDEPRLVQTLGAVRGLDGDSSLVGIDYRVKDGNLYGVGNKGGVYRIRLMDALATKVSQLTAALNGTSFDVDFNPAANLLRVVSDTGQNLRHNIDNAASALAVGRTATDASLSIPPEVPSAAGITGAAYTNNDDDPNTATTLFVLDTNRDQAAVQSPANAGLLAASGLLGVNANGDAGFEINTQAKGATGLGLATLEVNGARVLYRVDLLAGKVSRIGVFQGNQQVTDLAAGFRRAEVKGILSDLF